MLFDSKATVNYRMLLVCVVNFPLTHKHLLKWNVECAWTSHLSTEHNMTEPHCGLLEVILIACNSCSLSLSLSLLFSLWWTVGYYFLFPFCYCSLQTCLPHNFTLFLSTVSWTFILCYLSLLYSSSLLSLPFPLFSSSHLCWLAFSFALVLHCTPLLQSPSPSHHCRVRFW